MTFPYLKWKELFTDEEEAKEMKEYFWRIRKKINKNREDTERNRRDNE